MMMTALRALIPVLAFLLAATPVAAQDVGVAAAVNQSAFGTQPNTVLRTIGLGDNIVHNERIDTNSNGLVQLLLADGTTFTVGPNSSLVIDSFVYDPVAGTAQVAATLTKGVLRFIGAATSKTPDGVAITTPIGVVGIRGGVTDINMNPPAGIPPHISMIFGNSVTLSQGGQLLGRLFEAGYSLALTGGSISTVRTPGDWAGAIQQALSSGNGQNGGAPRSPNNSNVTTIAAVNSTQIPLVPPIPMPPLARPDQVADQIIGDATGNQIPSDQGGGDFGASEGGYAAGIILLDEGRGGTPYPIALGSASVPGFTEQTGVTFDNTGKPMSAVLALITTSETCEDFVCGLLLKIDPAGSTATGANGDHFETLPVTASLRSHEDVALPSGVGYCECDFLRWGFWSARAEIDTPGVAPGYLTVENGQWVVANDISTAAELSQLGAVTATYDGHAVGTYANEIDGIATLAASDMTLDWSFGSRTGTIEISDFGGRDLAGNLVGDRAIAGFLGTLSDGNNADGFSKGSFVNDGGKIAGGVMGDFFADDGTWRASGVFMGAQVP